MPFRLALELAHEIELLSAIHLALHQRPGAEDARIAIRRQVCVLETIRRRPSLVSSEEAAADFAHGHPAAVDAYRWATGVSTTSPAQSWEPVFNPKPAMTTVTHEA